MKNNKTFYVIVLLIASTFLFSCNDLAFDIDQTFSKSFTVNITEENTGGDDIILNEAVDVSSGELKENLDRIEELTIKSIKIKFTNGTGDSSAIITGNIGFPQILPELYNLPELNIASFVNSGEPFLLYSQDGTSFPGDPNFPAQAFIDNLVSFLKTLPADQLNTTYTLNSSAYPVGFDAELEIDIFAKVSAIE